MSGTTPEPFWSGAAEAALNFNKNPKLCKINLKNGENQLRYQRDRFQL